MQASPREYEVQVLKYVEKTHPDRVWVRMDAVHNHAIERPLKCHVSDLTLLEVQFRPASFPSGNRR